MKKRQAVLVIDMLNDFVTGSLKFDRAQSVILPLKKLISQARIHDVPVIYVNDSHLRDIDQELRLWGEHALKGTGGAQVIDELQPKSSDYMITKRRYSGFFQTELHLLLQELKVERIILTGVHTHMCVKHTAADAYYWGYELCVPIDATQATSEQDYQSGLKEMESLYGANLSNVEEILDNFK